MIRYLSKHFPISEHWYPKDSVKQAKVDEFLSWEHHNIGFLCYIYHNLQVCYLIFHVSNNLIKYFDEYHQ